MIGQMSCLSDTRLPTGVRGDTSCASWRAAKQLLLKAVENRENILVLFFAPPLLRKLCYPALIKLPTLNLPQPRRLLQSCSNFLFVS